MPFYLRTWELTDDLRPQWPTVYTPDMVLAHAVEPIVEEQELPDGTRAWATVTHEVTLIGECARWGRVPKLQHCNPYLMSEQHIAVEMWGQMATYAADGTCDTEAPQVWSYQVFPRLALTTPEIPPWDERDSPHTWVDPEAPLPVAVELDVTALPAVVYTTRTGHAWGKGPFPVTLGAGGEPDPDAFDLGPESPYLWSVVTMPPEQALAYTPDDLWQPEGSR